MKRIIILMLTVLLVLPVTGCTKEVTANETVEGNMKTYYRMSDGTWMCDDIVYENRLEITGRMPNAAADSTFVYLSNLEDISFEQAWKAAGLSSDTNDYFSKEDAVLVELR